MATFVIVAALALIAFETSGAAWSQPLAKLAEKRVLPAPHTSGGASLASVLASRRSQRTFGARELDDAELGQLLWAAQGITDGHRTAPSAGALYPLTIHVVDARGVWHYVPADHAVVRDAEGDHRDQLVSASFGQAATRAPEVLVVTADVAITAKKYGGRAERFATLEAGHVAENVLLEATALGLDAVPVGAFDEGAVRRALGLSAADTPLYLIPVGPPP